MINRTASPIRWILMLVFLSVLIFSARPASAQNETPNESAAAIKYAKAFTIDKYDGYKLLTVVRPWREADREFQYLIVPKGSPIPDGYLDAQVIQVPVENIAVLAATHFAYLNRLNLGETLIAVANPEYIYSEQVHDSVGKGTIAAVGNGPDINLEKLLSADPELVTTFAMGKSTKDDYQQLLDKGIPTVVFSDYMEESPLGRAEWLKVMALFFGKEAEADRIFAEIERRYIDLTELTRTVEEKPNVLMGYQLNGKWNVPGGRSVQAAYIRDAGGDYLWAEDETSGRFPLSFEAVLEKGASADFWFDLSLSWTAIDDLIGSDPRCAAIKAYTDGRIYNNNLRLSPWGANAYSETGLVNPDVILADLIHLMHPNLLPDHEPVYYRHLSADGF